MLCVLQKKYPARLDWSNPLTHGMLGAFVFSERAGLGATNLVDGSLATLQTVGSGGGSIWTENGFDFRNSTTNGNWFSVPVKNFVGIGTGNYSLVWGGWSNDVPGGYAATVFCFDDYDPQWGIDYDGTLHLYDGGVLFNGLVNVENTQYHAALVREGTGAGQV